MLKVLVRGAAGRMGQEVVRAVEAEEDMTTLALVDPQYSDPPENMSYRDLGHALHDLGLAKNMPDVMVDFTKREDIEKSIPWALSHGIHCVVGTTGISEEEWQALYREYLGWRQENGESNLANLFVAPNFAKSTVQTIIEAVQFVKNVECGIEIIERHRLQKLDAPSGTAIMTAKKLAPYVPDKFKNVGVGNEARGMFVEGIPVHAIRGDGYTAVLEIVCMFSGGTKIFSDEVKDRTVYMPGVVHAIREVINRPWLTIGLEHLL